MNEVNSKHSQILRSAINFQGVSSALEKTFQIQTLLKQLKYLRGGSEKDAGATSDVRSGFNPCRQLAQATTIFISFNSFVKYLTTNSYQHT